jgi:hypothetical protein
MGHPYLQAVGRALLTFWVGGMWTAGFVVAPLLFGELDDRALAGTLAGAIFNVIGTAGLACGAGLLLISWMSRVPGRLVTWQTFVLVTMLILTALGKFVLAPWIAELRAAGMTESARFAQAHGLASGVYIINSLLGLVLVTAARSDTG